MGSNPIAYRACVPASYTGTVVFASPTFNWCASNQWPLAFTNATLKFATIDTNEYVATNEAISITQTGIQLIDEGPGKLTLRSIYSSQVTTIRVNCERLAVLTISAGASAAYAKRGIGILEVAASSFTSTPPPSFNIYEGGFMLNGTFLTNVPTLHTGTVVGGSGKIIESSLYLNVGSNVTLIPGDKDVGIFTVANMRFQTNAIYEWHFKNGVGSKCVVTNNLVMYGGLPARLRIVDLGGGYSYRTNEHVIFTYSGADPANPNWQFEFIGNRFGNSSPTVTVDTVNKQVILKGISIPPPGTFIMVR